MVCTKCSLAAFARNENNPVLKKQSRNQFSAEKWAWTKPVLKEANSSYVRQTLILIKLRKTEFCWLNKRSSTRAPCRSMSPPHSVLTFHSNLHLRATSPTPGWSVTKHLHLPQWLWVTQAWCCALSLYRMLDVGLILCWKQSVRT